MAILGGEAAFARARARRQLNFPEFDRYRHTMRGLFERGWYTNQGRWPRNWKPALPSSSGSTTQSW